MHTVYITCPRLNKFNNVPVITIAITITQDGKYTIYNNTPCAIIYPNVYTGSTATTTVRFTIIDGVIIEVVCALMITGTTIITHAWRLSEYYDDLQNNLYYI